MESPSGKSEAPTCPRMPPGDLPTRYLPFLEAGFWPGPTPISPFLMGARGDLPPFWPVPWLPHLWSHPKQPDSNPEPSERFGPQLSPLSSNSPVLSNGPQRSRSGSVVDPVVALTTIEASPAVSRALASALPRRPRSEKRPIPDSQKDERYFERRKRNNLAAKKSRDARKAREDEIALRACFLEKENAILRAQVATLREEAQSLRQLLLQQKRHGDWCKT